jgi:putative membrane protein
MRFMPTVMVTFSLLAAPAYALPGPIRVAEVKAPLPQAPLPRTAAEYVRDTVTIGLFELASAKLVLQKSKSAEVRKYATTMIAAYNSDSENLNRALAASNFRAALPSTLDEEHVALLIQLRASSGVEFETRYIQQQIDAQEFSLEMHQNYAMRGGDSALKRFALDMQTRTARQLDEAQKISYSLGGLQPRA